MPTLPPKRKHDTDVQFVPATSLTLSGNGFTHKRLKISYGIKGAEVSCLLLLSFFPFELDPDIYSILYSVTFQSVRLISLSISDK